MTYPNTRDCKHGLLRGKCDNCDDEAEIEELKELIAELEKKQEFVPLDASWVYVKEDDVNLMINRIAELEADLENVGGRKARRIIS